MFEQDHIWVGQGEVPCNLLLNQANRHGLIAGASGTGKTVTLKVLAEGFSKAGVPVFMADVKGDVTGIAQAGDDTENITKRVEKFGIEDWQLEGCPTRLWDMLDDQGIPVRITISDMGPIMLSRLLELTEVQEGVLNIAFRVADDQQMLLIDLKDLRAMLNYVSEHSKEIETTYGKVSSQSVGAILRALIAIEDQGGDIFFGEPNLDLDDWFATDENGQGYVNVLNAARLINSPQIYAMFLLWMLSELFETLPEVGDADKPKFVFFFDEAHLLFNGMPKELLDKIVQVVKLIRSKGMGVYFITQSPSDIPDEVLAQLSNRIQHGLRAYTPAEQKAVKAAAQSFRENPAFNAKDKILELGTGEALVSFLDEEGKPSIVEYAKILPPQCRMAAADPEVIDRVLAAQEALMSKYGEAIDRESAYELISKQAEALDEEAKQAAEQAQADIEAAEAEKRKAKEAEKAARKLPELTKDAEHSLTVLRRAKEFLEAKPAVSDELSAAERRKRAQLKSKPVYRYVALTIFIFGIVAAAYGLYAITNHVGNYGIYFALFGFAAIFLFSSYNMLPTARNNHNSIMKRAEKAEQAAADYVKTYPNGAFPVPSYYAHPVVLKRMMDAIEEGRAVTVPEALDAVKNRLKELNADVQVDQDEYDEVVVIKAMFLNHDYE